MALIQSEMYLLTARFVLMPAFSMAKDMNAIPCTRVHSKFSATPEACESYNAERDPNLDSIDSIS